MVHVRLLAEIAVAVLMLTPASAAADSQPAKSAKGADEEAARNKGQTSGDLPLKDRDRILFIGDSIQDQKMWPCYVASYLILMNPGLTLHIQIQARGGTSLSSWLDSGNPKYEEYSKTAYALEPDYVFTFSTNNGGHNKEQHKQLQQALINNHIVGASGAVPILIGMIPLSNAGGHRMGGEYDDANEEIALAAKPNLRYVKTWQKLAPRFTQHRMFTADEATDVCSSPGHDFKDGMKVMLDCYGLGGLENNKIFYVRGAKRDTFQLAAAPDGPAIDITASKKGEHRISPAWPLLRGRLDDSDHPATPGQIAYAWVLITGLGFTTHVSSATIDTVTKKVVASDHCTVAYVTGNAHGGIDFTRTDQRLPWAIDEHGRQGAFFLFPEMKGWQDYSLKVTGLAPGTYDVLIDGADVADVTHAELAAGWNMADLTVGPVWEQVQEVLGRIRDMHGIDRTTLRDKPPPHDWDGVVGYERSVKNQYIDGKKRGKDLIQAMKGTVEKNIDALDKLIHEAAQPVKRTYSIRLKKAGGAP